MHIIHIHTPSIQSFWYLQAPYRVHVPIYKVLYHPGPVNHSAQPFNDELWSNTNSIIKNYAVQRHILADRRQICRRLSASRIISADSFRLGARCAYLSTSFTTPAMIASICETGGSMVERAGDIVAPIISNVCDTIDRAPCHRYGRWPSRWLVTCSS